MYEQEQDWLATPGEALVEFAWNAGTDKPEQAWLLHDRDVWVRNPHYSGPPVPHPEDDRDFQPTTEGNVVMAEACAIAAGIEILPF